MEITDVRYVGFWPRFLAFIVDSVVASLVVAPIVYAVYGPDPVLNDLLNPDELLANPDRLSDLLADRDLLLELIAGMTMIRGPVDFVMYVVFPAVAAVIFWIARQATPGKLMVSAKIVDADTGDKPSTKQCIVRYLGYYVSIAGLFLGFLWIAFDGRKQGWHDKMARTVVVKSD